MNIELLKEHIEGIDIYILDQILKGRYKLGDSILDAGCGNGRNLKWFYNAGFEIHGTDLNKNKINYCKEVYSNQKDNFILTSIEEMFFESNSFNHIICNAVLHFAKDLSHFLEMFEKLLRILKHGGSLFIRIASNFGMENEVTLIGDGVYILPDESKRFLLTQHILDNLLKRQNIFLIEDLKTTIVHNKRCMTTLVIQKV